MLRPVAPRPSANELHSGISMHRIRAVYAGVGDGPAGLLAAAGVIVVCLLGFPHARWFLLASIVTGFIAAVAFRRWYQRKPIEVERLSLRK
ncbi:MAG TPA: hypothetical protein VI488_06630 [Candidatus Angelobacter sp.]